MESSNTCNSKRSESLVVFLWKHVSLKDFLCALSGVVLSSSAVIAIGFGFYDCFRSTFPFFFYIIFLGCAGCAIGLGAFLRLYFAGRFAQKLWKNLFAHLLHHFLSYAGGKHTYHFPLIVEKAEKALEQMIGPAFFMVLRSVLQVCGSLGILMCYAPFWIFWLLIFLGCLSLPALLYRRILSALVKKMKHFEERYTINLQEITAKFNIIKIFQIEQWHHILTCAYHSDLLPFFQRKQTIRALFIGFMMGFVSLFLCGILWASLHALQVNILSQDVLILCVFFSILLVGSLNNIADAFVSIVHGYAQLKMLMKEGVSDTGRVLTNIPVKQIAFCAVDFAYDKNEVLFQDLNLVFKEGCFVALFAPSGLGKTTFAHLLLGVLRPTKGAILCHTDTPLSLWKKAGYVPQNCGLFSQSVKDQIVCGRSFDPEAFEQLLDLTHVRPFLSSLSKGLDTIIDGESGAPLSQGQAQRLALARALYTDPDLLVLDEPTSHLDQQTALSVMQGVKGLRKGGFTFLITHTLEIAKYARDIYTLRDRKLVRL